MPLPPALVREVYVPLFIYFLYEFCLPISRQFPHRRKRSKGSSFLPPLSSPFFFNAVINPLLLLSRIRTICRGTASRPIISEGRLNIAAGFAGGR